MARRSLFRVLRITFLLYALFMVAAHTLLTGSRATDWDDSLWVAVYPINAQGEPSVERYIQGLDEESFVSIERFLEREASRYGLAVRAPVLVSLGEVVEERPPPAPFGAGPLQVAWWSLRLRYWAFMAVSGKSGPAPHVRLFVVYHDPRRSSSVPHSLGLENGMLGVVHAFSGADYSAPNNVVIAHELLHTLGATDKYHPETNQPLFPDGYAEPEQLPLFPQHAAEIMAGRIPTKFGEPRIPSGLHMSVVGEVTAREIRWVQ